MGLDSVELVIEWENRTGATFTDGEAAGTRTPEDAFRVLRSKLPDSPDPRCAGQLAFAEVRRWLVSEGFARGDIRPKTALRSLDRHPAKLVKRLRRDLELDRPVGCHPLWISAAGIACVMAGATSLAGEVWIGSGLLLIVLGIAGAGTRSRFENVGDLARDIATRHSGRYRSSFTDEELRSIIRDTTIATLKLKEAEFGWEKRFVEDLGMD